MQVLSNQRKKIRHGRSRRQGKDVDPEALNSFWASLSLGKKLQVLHFEDHALVERAYVIQQMLWYSEIMCIKSGVSVRDGASRGVQTLAMEAFEFKWQLPSAGWLRGCRAGSGEVGDIATALLCSEATAHEMAPAVFAARLGFVNGEDFLERLERHTGTPLLDSLPELRREDWASVFEPTANSWAEYERQVWNLVRLALVHAYREAIASAAVETTTAAHPDVVAPEEVLQVVPELSDIDFDGLEPVMESYSSRRRARKRRKAARNGAKALSASSPLMGKHIQAEDDGADADEDDGRARGAGSNEDEEDNEAEEDDNSVFEGEGVEEDEAAEAQLHEQVDGREGPDAASAAEPEILAVPVLEDDGSATWETVSRKRVCQRARPPERPCSVRPAAQEASPQGAADHQPCNGEHGEEDEMVSSARLPSHPVASMQQPTSTPTTSSNNAQISSTDVPSAEALSAQADSGTSPQPKTPQRLQPLISLWQRENACQSSSPSSGAQRWHMFLPQASEAVCIMASVKRTFLDVAVFRSETTRSRARSCHAAICVC